MPFDWHWQQEDPEGPEAELEDPPTAYADPSSPDGIDHTALERDRKMREGPVTDGETPR